jgi:hypothetical protein
MHHCARHVEGVEIPALSTQRDDTTSVRVKYCLKDITDTRFSSLLQVMERKREFRLEKRQILETFVLLAYEFFTEMDATENFQDAQSFCRDRCETFVKQIEEMVNSPMETLRRRYNSSTPRIQTEVVELYGTRSWERLPNLFVTDGRRR